MGSCVVDDEVGIALPNQPTFEHVLDTRVAVRIIDTERGYQFIGPQTSLLGKPSQWGIQPRGPHCVRLQQDPIL
jgi:hypothetical protein